MILLILFCEIVKHMLFAQRTQKIALRVVAWSVTEDQIRIYEHLTTVSLHDSLTCAVNDSWMYRIDGYFSKRYVSRDLFNVSIEGNKNSRLFFHTVHPWIILMFGFECFSVSRFKFFTRREQVFCLCVFAD